MLCHRKDVQHMLTVVRYLRLTIAAGLSHLLGNWIVFWQSIRLSVMRAVA